MSASSSSFAGLPLRFGLISAVTGLLATSMIWLIGEHDRDTRLQQQADGLGNALARQTAIMVTELVLANDLISLNVLLNELTRDDPISQAAVLSVDDQVIAIAGDSGPGETGRINRYVAPIALQDSVAGYVRIHVDRDALAGPADRRDWMMLASLVLVLSLSISATLLFYRHYVGLPLQSLTVGLRELRRGKAWYCAFGERRDDVGRAIRAYNRLLPEQEHAASEHASRDTAASTALVLRINNHDWLEQHLSPEDATHVFQRCRQWLEQIATLYNGHILESEGEEFLLQFGHPARDEEQVFHALCSALVFMRLCERIPQCLPTKPPCSVEIKAGVHCTANPEHAAGEAVEGRNPFALAGRLAEASPVDSLLLSTRTLKQARGSERFRFEAYSRLRLQDEEGDVETCLLLGPATVGSRRLIEQQAERLMNAPQETGEARS